MIAVLVHTGCGQVVHVTKEYKLEEWHKPTVCIGFAEDDKPNKVLFKAQFDSREKVDLMIKLLESHRDSFRE
jgi:hypothetical protein